MGVIGCGNISGIYLKNARRLEILDVVACADLDLERARARAAEYDVPRACTVEELLADPAVEIVLNLTVPAAHGEVGLWALDAGKSLYNEKPLAIAREDALLLVERARARGLLLGGAPDTFLGAGLQTCRSLVDDGLIGAPVAATAFMLGHGAESWHPDPAFFYKPGAGPMLDMGPYYLTALVNLLGPVRRVTGSARASFPERAITSQPHHGETIVVEVPTHIAGVLDFASGPIGTIVTSFDVWASETPRLEVYGSAGTLSLPDPNTFGGPVRLRRPGEDRWSEVPLTHGYATNSRGLGLADMAYALRSGRPVRASGSLTYHVLDIMQSFEQASTEGRHVELDSTCERPTALPRDLPEGTLDA